MFRRCLARQVPCRRPPRSASDRPFCVPSSNSSVLRHGKLFRIPAGTPDNRCAACAEIFFRPLPDCWSCHSFRRTVNDASKLSPVPSDPFFTQKPAISYSSVVFPPPPMHTKPHGSCSFKNGNAVSISTGTSLCLSVASARFEASPLAPFFAFFSFYFLTLPYSFCAVKFYSRRQSLKKELPRSGMFPIRAVLLFLLNVYGKHRRI